MRFFGIFLDPFDEDSLGGLSGPHFFSLCYRLPVYDGVVAARIRKEEEDAKRKKAVEDGDFSAITEGNQKMNAVDFMKSRKAAKRSDNKGGPLSKVADEINSDSLYGTLIEYK